MLRVSGVRRPLLFFLLFFFFSSAVGFAHKVSIFAWIDGDTIYTESYFQDGNFIKNGKIEVKNSSGEVVHSGVTDENGEHHFRVPQVDTLTIVLDASMGHRATFEISEDELEGAHTKGYHSGSDRGNQEADTSFYEIGANNNSTHQSIELDEIRAVVRDEISQQLKPIVRDVAELNAKRGISAQEVFAGIGYLLGLMGIVMYFKSKGKK